MTGDAAELIAEMTAQNRDAVKLARLLSFAAPIEPALMRAMRLELLPRADVSAEADLWFGPLVEMRNRDGIMLIPEVAETLRGGLKARLAERCFRIIERLHDYLPPAVQLEEKLNFLSLDPTGNAGEITALLQSALTALIGEARGEVANWAGRALPRLAPAVRQTEGARRLAAASDLRLGRGFRIDLDRFYGGTIPDWVADVLPAGFPRAEIGVRLAGDTLMLERAPTRDTPRISVPATDPLLVQVVDAGSQSTRIARVALADATGTQSVTLAGDGTIELRTLAGEAFTLERLETSAPSTETALACAAYASCNEALVVWQSAAPIPRCLGFAIERIGTRGEGEFLKNRIGFQRSIPASGPQPSTVFPIQRFVWIDVPDRRSTYTIYSYRITPVIGTPDKLELVTERAARTSPVDVAVKRDGPITALFNRQPTALSALSSSEANAYGGEVRNALLQIISDAQVDDETTIYAALFMIDDPELVEALAALGERADIILSGDPMVTWKSERFSGAALASARKSLDRTRFRMRGRGLRYSHNSFMVVCRRDAPQRVWTGSVIWTTTCFYSQDSNALIIEDGNVAARYLAQWQRLAGDPPRAQMVAANAQPMDFTLTDSTGVRLWFAPVDGFVDLSELRALVDSAKFAILFAVGPRGKRTILDDIIALSGRLYVAGVTRSSDSQRVALHEHGNEVLVNPERLPRGAFGNLGVRLNAVTVPIGSRLIVIDPFGDSPVVITGSHTFSQSASRSNDENLLIIRGNRALAQACAVHIKGLIDHYAFRARVGPAKTHRLLPLSRDDSWQQRYLSGEREKEIAFWMGMLGASRAAVLETPQDAKAEEAGRTKPRSKRKAGKSARRTKTAKKTVKKAAKKTAKKAASKKTVSKRTVGKKTVSKKTPSRKSSARAKSRSPQAASASLPGRAGTRAVAANEEHLMRLREGVQAWNAWRLGNQEPVALSGVDLSSANLSGVNLSRADLSHAKLSDTNLSGANLSGANLSGVNLTRVDLSRAKLSDANLSGANLSGANLSGVNLSGANLSGANLSSTKLLAANLTNADLTRAYLSDADLSGADLSGADLSGANLSQAMLSETILVNANLTDVIGLAPNKPA